MLVLVSLSLAYRFRFMQDDAFITLIYARSFAEGSGLAWFGARVEGYTNFLWTVWASIPFFLDIDPIPWLQFSGLFAFVFAIVGVFRLSELVLKSSRAAFLSSAVFSMNYSVLSYATGGLETMLFSALIVWLFYFCMKEPTSRWPVMPAVLSGAIIMTRPDGVIPVLFAFGYLTLRKDGWRTRLFFSLRSLFLLSLGLAPWLVWKWFYYGSLLPNTFYAKTDPSLLKVIVGLDYIWSYLTDYGYWPFLLTGLVLGGWRFCTSRTVSRPVLFLSLFSAAWFGYLIYIGGDFMEYRMLIPVSGALSLLIVAVVTLLLVPRLRAPFSREAALTVIPLLLIIIGLNSQSRRGPLFEHRVVDTIPQLATFYSTYPENDWDRIASRLAELFGDLEPTIALHPAGAIPFYSRIKSIDMLGLNDPYIARHGIEAPKFYPRPGHQKLSPLVYLQKQEVNFVLGHPSVVRERTVERMGGLESVVDIWFQKHVLHFECPSVSEISIVKMPLSETKFIFLWYLTEEASIDKRLQALNLNKYTIRGARLRGTARGCEVFQKGHRYFESIT